MTRRITKLSCDDFGREEHNKEGEETDKRTIKKKGRYGAGALA